MRQLVLIFLLALPGFAQEADKAEEKPWKNTLSLYALVTEGNSETTTVGLTEKFVYNWDRSQFTLNLVSFKKDVTDLSRQAVLLPDGTVMITEDRESETIAEKLGLNLLYERKIKERYFWQAHLSHNRNRFAGIDSRDELYMNLGVSILKSERHSLKAYAGLGYAREDLVAEGLVDENEAYFAQHIGYDWEMKFKNGSTFEQHLELNGNAEESSDLRGAFKNKLQAPLSKHFSLTVELIMDYDNRPAFLLIPYFQQTGGAGGDAVLNPIPGGLPYELERVDSSIHVGLTLDF